MGAKPEAVFGGGKGYALLEDVLVDGVGGNRRDTVDARDRVVPARRRAVDGGVKSAMRSSSSGAVSGLSVSLDPLATVAFRT